VCGTGEGGDAPILMAGSAPNDLLLHFFFLIFSRNAHRPRSFFEIIQRGRADEGSLDEGKFVQSAVFEVDRERDFKSSARGRAKGKRGDTRQQTHIS